MASAAKHTEGPFVVSGTYAPKSIFRLAVIEPVTTNVVALVECAADDAEAVETTKADAALLAAAPELADALEALRSWAIQHPRTSLWTEQERDMLTSATDALSRAGRLQ